MFEESFFIYPGSSGLQLQDEQEKHYILLHPNASNWVKVNETGLEIAKSLQKETSLEAAANSLSVKYGISKETALQDVLQVKEQLTKEGILEKRHITPRSPTLHSVFFHLTNRCNLSCSHCYVSCPDEKKSHHLPASLVEQLIAELLDHGGQNITLSGGEPLLHPEIRKIIIFAASKLGVRLLTNGTLINKEWAGFLADLNVQIQLSLDGSTGKIHDAVRGKGSYQKALQAIEYLQDAGIGSRIVLCATIMNHNISDLENIISLAEKLHIPLVRFLALRNVGTAKRQWSNIGDGTRLSEYENFYQYVSDLQINKKRNIEISCGLSGVLLKMPDAFLKDDLWCPVGRRLVIDSNGDAYPCALMMDTPFRLEEGTEGLKEGTEGQRQRV